MSSTDSHDQSLRVLVANETQDSLGTVTNVLAGLGHVVAAAEIDAGEIAAATRREHPDVALVALGDSSQHALEMIDQIVHEAACPAIALLHDGDPNFVNEAAKRAVFAYVTTDDPGELQSTLDIVLRRFAEYHNLEGAFLRRASIEQAKGRSRSQETGKRLLDLAEAVVHSHRLLAARGKARLEEYAS